MNGSLTYGPAGRLISAMAIISAFIGALESSGYVAFLPQRYKWIGIVVTLAGLVIAGASERIQGGASDPRVRDEAAQSDIKNAAETQGKDLNDTNC